MEQHCLGSSLSLSYLHGEVLLCVSPGACLSGPSVGAFCNDMALKCNPYSLELKHLLHVRQCHPL